VNNDLVNGDDPKYFQDQLRERLGILKKDISPKSAGDTGTHRGLQPRDRSDNPFSRRRIGRPGQSGSQ
jgi:hypothetical protein